MVVDHHDARLAAATRERAGDVVAAGAQSHEVHVVLMRDVVASLLAHGDAARRGHRRGVHVGDRLLRRAPEEAAHRRERDDAGVVGADFSARLHFDFAGIARHHVGEEPAETLGQRNEGLQRLVGFGRIDVHRERHEVAGERELHHVGDHFAGFVLRLARAGAEVRRDDHVGQREER